MFLHPPFLNCKLNGQRLRYPHHCEMNALNNFNSCWKMHKRMKLYMLLEDAPGGAQCCFSCAGARATTGDDGRRARERCGGGGDPAAAASPDDVWEAAWLGESCTGRRAVRFSCVGARATIDGGRCGGGGRTAPFRRPLRIRAGRKRLAARLKSGPKPEACWRDSLQAGSYFLRLGPKPGVCWRYSNPSSI
jgi:hypothetical protein